MKRIFTLFLALALSASGISAFAQEQDKQLANHLALGITLGLDGVGLEAALPITPYVQARAGYSIFPYTFKRPINLGNVEIGGETKSLDNIPFAATIWKGGTGKLLFDIYPGRRTPFHFTVGLYIGSGKFLHAQADISRVLDPSDYATLAFTYDKITVSTDPKGVVNLDNKMGNVIPYVGIGVGRAVRPGSRVSVGFDLGALITGRTRFQTYNYVNLEGKAQPVVLSSELLADEQGNYRDGGWINKLTSFPVLPMLKLNVFIRLF